MSAWIETPDAKPLVMDPARRTLMSAWIETPECRRGRRSGVALSHSHECVD